MSEQQPASEYRGRYTNARDEALHTMWGEGWANQSSGHVDAPTGAFARVSNYADELHEIEQVFEADLRTLSVRAFDLLGHFILIDDSFGFAHVVVYPDEQSAKVAYDDLEQQFSGWEGQA